IGSVTNGVHARTWTAAGLQSRTDLSDEDLWRMHTDCKRELLERVAPELDAHALTIGFARRFATYKRAGLLFSDADRLARIVTDGERPLQVLLAGKAHPADEGGKQLIREIWELTRDGRFAGRIVFIDDYEMTLARHRVQGVVEWLNTPRRPEVLSGTSGKK